MDHFKTYYLTIVLVLSFFGLRGQTEIDISTGVDNAGNLLPINSSVSPYNSIDPKWTVGHCYGGCLSEIENAPLAPVPIIFHPAAIGSGIPETPVSYPAFLGPHNSSVRWISPDVNSSGEHRNNSLPDWFHYKMTFAYNPCSQISNTCSGNPVTASSAVFHFDFIAGDDFIQVIYINGHSLSAYSPFAPGNIPWSSYPASYSNLDISFPPNLLVAGTNTIVVAVNNLYTGNQTIPQWIPTHTGLEIKGKLMINEYDLKDQDGNLKNQFCIGDDVILCRDAMASPFCHLDLYDMYSGSPALLKSQDYTGDPRSINITEIFSAATLNYFLPGNYRIKLTSHTSCGDQIIEKDFSYSCCGAVDPSFSLNIVNGELKGETRIRGVHQWNVYATPTINSGPYSSIATGLTRHQISVSDPSSCFYVTHKITTACGTACTGRRLCVTDCNKRSCNLDQKPENVRISQADNTISWDPVPGAVDYIVEIVMNSQACCPVSDLGPTTNTYQVTGTSYLPAFPPQFPGYPMPPPCYAVRVWAKCPDGSLSMASDVICSNDMSHMRTAPLNKTEAKTGQVSLNVFPNPSSGKVFIAIQTSGDGPVDLSIYDNTGKLIKHYTEPAVSGKLNLEWENSAPAKGIYLVKLLTKDNQLCTKKLIIQ
jgi:hypothetical protein